MNTKLQNLGFDDFFENQCKKLDISPDNLARVIAEHRGVYIVKNPNGEFHARITGKQMFDAVSREDYPAVGDWVVVDILDHDQASIKQILPRKSIIRKTVSSRKNTERIKNQIVATNVDVAFIVESVDRDYSLNRIERYIALANDGNVSTSIVLNKIDLISEDKLRDIIAEIQDRFKDCSVLSTSTQNLDGLDDLKNQIQSGKTYCFLGSSGVGKSSLINILIGNKIAKTGTIGDKTGRGKHITTHREMYFLDHGGIVIDNPGMREVGLTNSEIGIDATFSEIRDLATQCQFTDCTHTHEPGCAVRNAVDMHKLDDDQYQNYIQLKKEVEYLDMSDQERRNKEKKFGRQIKKYHDKMKKFHK